MNALVYHPAYTTYDFGPDHPFSPIRLEILVDLLEALGHPLASTDLEPATRDDVLRVHSEAYVEQVEAASEGAPKIDARDYGLDTGDVPVFEGMDEATRWLVGGTLYGADRIATGAAQRVLQLGGGLHHAHRAQAGGFCVYNDVAIAIHKLREHGHRVAYVDIDVHHGDGVQTIYYESTDVLTISLHESGRMLYPGTGFVEEIGEGPGRGYALNVPLAPFTPDESYLEAFEAVVPDALERFAPDVLVVECGADAHAEDPLAHLMLTTMGYEQLFRRLLELAGTHTDGRLLCTLGGGYDLDATVRVWALLVLIMQGLELPERVPDAWHLRWQRRLNRSLSPTLHDSGAGVSIPRRSSITEHNRETVDALLRNVTAVWS